jgi:hypothetical protein
LDYQKLKKVLKDEAKKKGGKKGKSKDKKDSNQDSGKNSDGKDGISSNSKVAKAAVAAPQAGEKSVLLASQPPSQPPKPPAAADVEAAAPKGMPASKSWLERLSGSGAAPDGAKAAEELVDSAVERVGDRAKSYSVGVGVGLVGGGVYTYARRNGLLLGTALAFA